MVVWLRTLEYVLYLMHDMYRWNDNRVKDNHHSVTGRLLVSTRKLHFCDMILLVCMLVLNIPTHALIKQIIILCIYSTAGLPGDYSEKEPYLLPMGCQ